MKKIIKSGDYLYIKGLPPIFLGNPKDKGIKECGNCGEETYLDELKGYDCLCQRCAGQKY